MADDAGIINDIMTETSFLYGGNAGFVEDLYARWAADPNSVEPSWRAFFLSLPDRLEEAKAAALRPSWTARSAPAPRPDWLSAMDGMWPAVEAKLGARLQSAPRPQPLRRPRPRRQPKPFVQRPWIPCAPS